MAKHNKNKQHSMNKWLIAHNMNKQSNTKFYTPDLGCEVFKSDDHFIY